MSSKQHPVQMDLIAWANCRPTNVIDARPRFEAKVAALVIQMITTNKLPPHVDGKVITIPKRGAA